MAYVPTAAESYGTDASVIQLDSSHPGYVSVPDAKFLFTAEFHRAGPDLLLTGQDGERHLIPGYFAAAERPALTAPNGASLSPELIHLLAGSVAPGQYAQAQPSAPPDSIGKIEKVVGNVTIVRNGVSVALNVGDAVYKSDVIQTGANSSVGIGFPDGTALQLVANTRMALNDYSYDPNGTSNTALFSLVEGTFAFVAGKVAHTGDMKIATPVATMGIRGTTGYVQEAATISANSGNVSYSYVIVDDYGSTNHGQYDLIGQSGNVLATVSQTEYITYVTPQGIGLPPLVSTMPMSNSQVAFGQALIQQVFQTLNLINNPNPQTNGTNGSSTPEQLNSPLLPQLINDQGTIPLDLNGSGGGSSLTPVTVTIDIVNPPPIAATTNIFIWAFPSSGTFQTAPDWNTGAVPAASDTVEINNPLVTVTIDQVETVNNLMIVAGAVVNIVDDSIGNGFLTILSGLDNAGLIEVGSQGSDPKLEDIGATTVASGAQIEANGSDATVDYQNNQVVNAGIIDATNSGTVSFEFVTIDNEPGGTAGEGNIIAQLGGTVTLDHTIIDNTDGGLNDGSVVANGAGSTVFLYDGTTVVGGTLSTSDGGLIEIANGPDETSSNVTFDGSETSGDGVLPVTIASGSEVQVAGGTSLTLLGAIVNEGTINIDGVLGADLVIDGIVTLSGGGAVMLTGSSDEITGASNGGTLDNVDDTISGAGGIVGTVNAPLTLDNQENGVIEASLADGTLTLNTGANAIINAGLIEANGGALVIDDTPVTNTGTLKATDDSALALSGDTVTNTAGTVQVDAGSTLDLEGSSVNGGTVDVSGTLDSTGTSSISDAPLIDTGLVEVTSGTLTIDPNWVINSGLLEANGGSLVIDDTPVTNTGTLKATDDSALALSGDTVTNTAGTVQVDAGSTLDLEGSSINGGMVDVSGTLNSTGTSAIDGASLTDSRVVESTSGTLTIGPGSIDNSGLLEANGGSLVIDDTPVTNTGTLKATDDSALALSGDTVTNTAGTVQVDAGSTLDLEGSSVNGGKVDVSGTLDSTGTSSINGANLTDTDLVEVTSDTLTLSGDTVTNTGGVVQVDAGSLLDFGSSSIAGGTLDVYGTLNSTGAGSINGASLTTSGVVESTSGTLTIDPGSVDNSGLLEANGGALVIDDTPVTNTGTLKATDDSALALSGDTVTNTAGLVQMDAGSTIDLEGSGISGGTIDVSGALNSTGTSSISAATLIDAGLVEVTSGTLTIDDTPVINTGTLQAAGASTLIIGGAVDNSLGTVVVDYGSKVDIGGDIFDGNAVVDGGTLTYGSSSNVGTSFDGIGMLVLDGTNSSNQFTGTVSDFGNGDIIDLAAISYSDETGLTYNAHLDTLTVSDGISGPSMTIQLAGSYSASNFVLSNDGNGDAELTFTAGEAHESPTLWLDATTATVSQGSTVVLPTIRVIRVDSDDTLTLTIAGLPTGATITDSADSKVFSGSSFTLTGAEVGSTLTLHDGSNSGNFTLNVTANNTTIGEAASSATQTLAVTVNPSVGPAGVAGSPINLALANPSAANGAAVTVTITGVPSDWQLNQGTNLGNGTWTVQSDDLTTLTVLTAAAYAGAVELGVTETWTGANGATGLATIADNVETYAAGSPIFAWSGDDTLTGVGGHDEFVFAQSIGSDTIYNFNVATDKIDLLGFANVASFGDVEGHVTADSNGDAVITLGAGETITLHGVNVGSLTAADFVFNETPVVDNAGTLAVSDGATLPLDGTIDNTGTITLNGTGDQTELQIVGDGVTLQGGGQITMSDGAGDIIVGATAATTLTNVDNTISGAGQIGAGDGNLTLVNEVHGTIEANIAGGILTVDTGNDITNNGILEATSGGVLQIDDAVSGSGHAVIAGGTVAFEAAANIDVIFDNGTSTPTYGELVLGDASAFAGQISGFSGTAPDAGHSDVIDLAGINYDSSSFSETYNASSGLLTVSDGSNIANLTLDNFDGTLSIASNGDGGTLITDPPATSSITADGVLSLPADGPAPTYTESVTPNGHDYVGSFSLDPVTDGNGSPSAAFQFALGNDQINLAPGQVLTQSYNVDIAAQNPADTLNQTVAVSIGGPGADNFVFAPGIGAETIANFDPQHDTIELNGFTDAHTVAELQSLITTDLHGDAVIDLGHNDSITLAGVTAGHLQAVLQSAVHLH